MSIEKVNRQHRAYYSGELRDPDLIKINHDSLWRTIDDRGIAPEHRLDLRDLLTLDYILT